MLQSQTFTMKIPWLKFNMTMKKSMCFILILVLIPSVQLKSSKRQLEPGSQGLESVLQSDACPKLIPRYFSNVQPKGGLNNTWIKHPEVNNKEDCVKSCCVNQFCNMVFVYTNDSILTCYQVTCAEDENCLPTQPDPKVANSLKDKSLMVLVRSKADSWLNVDPSLAQFQALQGPKTCEVGLQECNNGPNEECISNNPKSRNGMCHCKKGFERNLNEICVQIQPIVTPIEVQVHSKNITLPENKATLSAYAIPEPDANDKYNYEWTLISGPSDSGLMENRQMQTVSLKQLQEGTYLFKVVVSGGNPEVHGLGFGNVTVFPPERINKAPKAVVNPGERNVTLPTSKAVIDAAASTDDYNLAKDLKFKWEIISSPLGFQQELQDLPTITLEKLVVGNYSLRVTVTDSDGASDSAVAKVRVNEEKDYPPVANAGGDIIINLPTNEVQLNGNQSTDDHKIVNWEWTLNEVNDNKVAADTKDMRTAYPHISNLEEGTYSFHLKVTDIKGQSGEDEVLVYVKAPINQPPIAKTGQNRTLNLPKNWVVLDGSESEDDFGILSWTWDQLQGPNQAVLINKNASKCNATNLTKGNYVFQLTVKDKEDNENSAIMGVTVNQDTNTAPKANAGNDVIVTLPQNLVVINGSDSSDDLKIAKYKWTRDVKSLAAGKMLGNSSQEAVLYLVNLVPGVYIFNLKVWDDQGKSSSDSVSITVQENPNRKHVIRAILDINITSLTQSHMKDFQQGVSLLIKSDDNKLEPNVKILNILPQQDTNLAILHFMIELKNEKEEIKILPGIKAVQELKNKLRGGDDIIGLKIADLDTLICQNDCSGHGYCKQEIRSCVCEPFWIENFVRRSLMDGKSNCEWSVIYVGIFISLLLAGSVCGVIFISCKHKRGQIGKGKSSRSRKRYTRLEQNDDTFELRNAHTSSLMMSDSDSEDEEIAFDDDLNRKPMINGVGGNVNKRNGIAKAHQNARA